MPQLTQTTESNKRPPTDWHPVIYAAVIPSALLQFGVSWYVCNLRPTLEMASDDFAMQTPLTTQWILWLTSSSILVVGLPVVSTAIMIWFAQRKPTSQALCVVMGCSFTALGILILFYVSLVSPLIQLMKDLS